MEGVADYHLLGIHHVWPAGPGSVLLWDFTFRALGAVLVVAGYGVVRSGPADTARDATDGTTAD